MTTDEMMRLLNNHYPCLTQDQYFEYKRRVYEALTGEKTIIMGKYGDMIINTARGKLND